MSLFLPYEKMWDMPLGGTSDEKQVPHWAGNLIWGFLAFVFKICFRYRVDHRESLRGFKDKTGVVVVGNHTSFLDVAFMYLAGRPSQWVRFLGRENLFLSLIHILPLLLMAMNMPVFGYAKPVPYNPAYFKDPRKGDLIVGLAGPAANLVLAVLGAVVYTCLLYTSRCV